MVDRISFIVDDLLNKITNSGEYINSIEAIKLIAESQQRTIHEVAAYLYHNDFAKYTPMYQANYSKRNEFESEVDYIQADKKHGGNNWRQTGIFIHQVKWGDESIFTDPYDKEVIHGFGEQYFVKAKENFLKRWKDYYWATTDLLEFEPLKRLNASEIRGLKPDWNCWLNLYEVNVLSLISLSMGINPLGDKSHYSSLLDEVVIPAGTREFERRESILLSYIGNKGQPFIFKDEDKISKIYANIKLKDFVEWAIKLNWELPNELRNLIEKSNQTDLGKPALLQVSPEISNHYQNQLKEKDAKIVELEQRIADLELQSTFLQEKELPSRTANNALKIINALAHMAELDISSPFAAYTVLETYATLNKLELPSKDTVAKWFNSK